MPEIVLECKPDETLVSALGYNRKMITHQPSKGQVINFLKRNPGAIGIVDEDTGSANPTYFSKFQMEAEEQFNLECLCIHKEHTRLIIIKPRLEERILKYAILSNIDLQEHSLPDSGHSLHKIINTRLTRFENMIKEMLDKNNEALLYLKKVIDKNQS